MSTWIIIPAFNESKHLGEVIRKTKTNTTNIIVVDDGSHDNTSEIAQKEGVTVLRHVVNLGKGTALRTGCDFAVKKNAKSIVVMDADGQHNPERIPLLLQELEGKDIVFGYRRLSKNMPFILRFGNYVISKSTKILFNIKLQDTQCGFRAFSADAYNKLRWNSSDYSMESEMIANTGRFKLQYKEVPIETIYNDKYKGTTVIDGIKIFLKMMWWKLT